MTPKEKANELVDKFYPLLDGSSSVYTSKQCALIAVDEMIDNAPLLSEIKNYWREVREEVISIKNY